MPRPVAMMSAALAAAASSVILPNFIGAPVAPPLPTPNYVVTSTQNGGTTAAGPNGAAPPLPETANGSSPGSGAVGAPASQSGALLVTQSSTASLIFKPKDRGYVGYLTLRNDHGRPQPITLELLLLRDREGATITGSSFSVEPKEPIAIKPVRPSKLEDFDCATQYRQVGSATVLENLNGWKALTPVAGGRLAPHRLVAHPPGHVPGW